MPPRAWLQPRRRSRTGFHAHTAVVAVVGLGYVGLPSAIETAKVAYQVIGVDHNPELLKKLRRGENYIPDVKDDEIRAMVEVGKIVAVAVAD